MKQRTFYIDKRTKTGFEYFRTKCRYVRWAPQKIKSDGQDKPHSMNVPFCEHEKNRIRKKKKDYAPVCHKDICPFYNRPDGEEHETH